MRARGLPDWLDSFRGKRAQCFWGLEFECETLGDADAFPAKNTHFEEFVHSRKSTKSIYFFFAFEGKRFTEMQKGFLQVLLHRAWAYSRKSAPLETASSKYCWGISFECVREDSIQ